MKKLLILIFMVAMTQARADVLLDIMNGMKFEFYVPQQNVEQFNEYEPSSGSGEPEHYSWDNLYPCHYCGIEIIVDPYAETSQDEILFDY